MGIEYTHKFKFILWMLLFLFFTALAGSLCGIIWWFLGVFIKFTAVFIKGGFSLENTVTLFHYYLSRPSTAERIVEYCISGFILMQFCTLFAVQVAWAGGNPFCIFTKSFNSGEKIPGLQ